MRRACSIPGCEKTTVAHKFCDPHYRRWLKHGDPLGGRHSPGVVDRFFRETVLTYTGSDCLTWPFARTKKGYAQVFYDGRLRIASRVICEIEHGPPPTPDHEAAHSCGRGADACVNRHHVSWKTSVENAADKLLHGTAGRGEQHPSAKLTEADVRAIRAAAATHVALADQYGVSRTTISQIRSGRRWASVLPLEAG